MQLQVIVNSAHRLKNVNWRYGTLHPYAVVWIDSSGKCSTKIDLNNNMNPVWNEKFSIPLPATSLAETAILHIDIVHANAAPGTKPLVGSVRFPLCTVLNEARANGKVSRCLNLLRPSGRPQGTVEIMIGVRDTNLSLVNRMHANAQFQARPQMQRPQFPNQPRPIQPQPVVQKHQYPNPPQQQVQPRPRPYSHAQVRPRSQPHVQPINQYPNNPAQVRPVVYPPNSQGLARPTPVQGSIYSMPADTNRPPYSPIRPVPAQNQNNSAFGIGTGADVTKLNRAMPILQNQNVQLANNSSSNANAAPVAAGTNNGQIQCAPSANEGTNNSTVNYVEENSTVENCVEETYTVKNYVEETYTVENYAEETRIVETYAESTQLYAETNNMSAGGDNGANYYCEYATEEYENGGYDLNAGGVSANGGYDINAGGECENGDYDMNPVEEYDNGVYDNGDYSDIQCDDAGLDSQVNCEEVDVSVE